MASNIIQDLDVDLSRTHYDLDYIDPINHGLAWWEKSFIHEYATTWLRPIPNLGWVNLTPHTPLRREVRSNVNVHAGRMRGPMDRPNALANVFLGPDEYAWIAGTEQMFADPYTYPYAWGIWFRTLPGDDIPFQTMLSSIEAGGGYAYGTEIAIARYNIFAGGTDTTSVIGVYSNSWYHPHPPSHITINDGKWHYFEFVRDGGLLYFFLDGILYHNQGVANHGIPALPISINCRYATRVPSPESASTTYTYYGDILLRYTRANGSDIYNSWNKWNGSEWNTHRSSRLFAWPDAVTGDIFQESVDHTITLSDTLAQTVDYGRLLTDVLTYTDQMAWNGIFIRELLDEILISDVSSAAKEAVRALTDILTLSDSINSQTTYIRDLIEIIEYTDQAIGSLNAQQIVEQLLTLTDNLTVQKISEQSLEDLVTFVDSLINTKESNQSFSDVLTLADELIGSKVSSQSLTDIITLTDLVERVVGLKSIFPESNYGIFGSRIMG